jgi:hypothetical protein
MLYLSGSTYIATEHTTFNFRIRSIRWSENRPLIRAARHSVSHKTLCLKSYDDCSTRPYKGVRDKDIMLTLILGIAAYAGHRGHKSSEEKKRSIHILSAFSLQHPSKYPQSSRQNLKRIRLARSQVPDPTFPATTEQTSRTASSM